MEKASAVDPELAKAYGMRSYLRRIFPRDWEGAQADLARVLALEPGNPAAQMNMGTLLTAMGRAPEAIILLMEAVKRDPTFDLAWPALGEAYLANGQIALAKDALTRALEISPEDTRALVQLGNLALIAGDPTAALAIYQRSSAEASRVFGSALAPHEIGHYAESRIMPIAVVADAVSPRQRWRLGDTRLGMIRGSRRSREPGSHALALGVRASPR